MHRLIGRVEDGVDDAGRVRVEHEQRVGAVDEAEGGENGLFDGGMNRKVVDADEKAEDLLRDRAGRDVVDGGLRSWRSGEDFISRMRRLGQDKKDKLGCSSLNRSNSPCSQKSAVMKLRTLT